MLRNFPNELRTSAKLQSLVGRLGVVRYSGREIRFRGATSSKGTMPENSLKGSAGVSEPPWRHAFSTHNLPHAQNHVETKKISEMFRNFRNDHRASAPLESLVGGVRGTVPQGWPTELRGPRHPGQPCQGVPGGGGFGGASGPSSRAQFLRP